MRPQLRAVVLAIRDRLLLSRNLLGSLLPQFGQGSNMVTRTRASAQTFLDHEGILRTAPAGCMSPTGMRFVRNLLTFTEDFSNAAWGKNATCTITGTQQINLPAITDYVSQQVSAANLPSGSAIIYSLTLAGSGTINIATASGDGDHTVTLSATPTRVSFLMTTSGTLTVFIIKRAGNTATAVTCTSIQVENVTGQSVQTPGEYQSVGVLSAPYQGLGADGCAAFATKLDGTPIAAALMIGGLFEGARTNLCINYNVAPTDLTNVSKGGDAAAILSVVSDAAAIAAAGLSEICSGNVYKLDNSAGTTPAYAVCAGVTSAAVHTGSVYARASSGSWSASLYTFNSATATSSSYQRLYASGLCAINSQTAVVAAAHSVVYFIGNQTESGTYPSSLIAVAGSTVTRPADVDSAPTASNLLAAQGAESMHITPQHASVVGNVTAFWGTYVDASNYSQVLHDGTGWIFRKRIGGVNYDASLAGSYLAATGYDIAWWWGTSGTGICVNGVIGTGNADTQPIQLAATMQTGADGNSLQQPFACIRNERVWGNTVSPSVLAAIQS